MTAPEEQGLVLCNMWFNTFWNAYPDTEYVNEIPISLDKGYYISPFIRANYVLKRVFKYFGYDL
ncbi:Uncharacterised protein [Segatella copri]|nr:Uncharacterised protein [Segatella copri]